MNEFLRIVFKACGMLLEQLIYSSAAALKRNVVVDVDPLKTCNSSLTLTIRLKVKVNELLHV